MNLSIRNSITCRNPVSIFEVKVVNFDNFTRGYLLQEKWVNETAASHRLTLIIETKSPLSKEDLKKKLDCRPQGYEPLSAQFVILICELGWFALLMTIFCFQKQLLFFCRGGASITLCRLVILYSLTCPT